MNEKGLRHHLDSIQHEAQMLQAYGNELSANSIPISKEAIISAFQRQQKEIELYKGIAESCECND